MGQMQTHSPQEITRLLVAWLVAANIDGTGEQILATRNAPDFFYFEGACRMSWSPDGKFVCLSGRQQ